MLNIGVKEGILIRTDVVVMISCITINEAGLYFFLWAINKIIHYEITMIYQDISHNELFFNAQRSVTLLLLLPICLSYNRRIIKFVEMSYFFIYWRVELRVRSLISQHKKKIKLLRTCIYIFLYFVSLFFLREEEKCFVIRTLCSLRNFPRIFPRFPKGDFLISFSYPLPLWACIGNRL